MRRIISTILIVFISILILNNFFASYTKIDSRLQYNNIEIDTLKTDDDTLNLKLDTVKKIETKDSSIVEKIKIKKHLTIRMATWYHTRGTIVHREHPTAATHGSIPRGSWLLVKNVNSNDSCIVEVTDRHGMGTEYIDLSHKAFGILSKHSAGKIKVIVKQIF